MSTDDLAGILVPQTTAGMRHSMAKILEWNPDTFENVMWWNGTEVTNMRIGNPVDALSYTPNIWVSVTVVDSSGGEGVGQCFISGRIIDPGGAAAEGAISFLRGTLAREISAEIFADRLTFGWDDAIAERSATTFGPPDVIGDPGPSATADISIGKALVIMSADVKFSSDDDSGAFASAGLMGYRVSGATSIAPDAEGNRRSLGATVERYGTLGDDTGVNAAATITKVVVEENLNPGLNTFTCEYLKVSGALENFHLSGRVIAVLGI